ncbi:MAG: hypothetical protein HW402_617 [Dehalococcoidales bacterium]|nr:hypothetical protein [Dehalococcoidales bacterium]
MGKVRLEIRPWLSDVLSARGWGLSVLEEEIAEGATLGDLLSKLTARSQAFDEVLFEPETHRLNSSVGIIINEQLSSSLNGLEAILQDGDTVMLLPFIDGG